MQVNEQSNLGKLFLIPSSLDQDAPKDFLIEEQKKQLNNISYFIVEKEKPARKMMKKLNLEKKIQDLILFPNSQKTGDNEICEMLSPIFSGYDIGLLSDSGSPCIADPGNKIVSYAHKKGVIVKPLIGPSSIILSLMSSGFNGQNFRFKGYLPIKQKERIYAIKEMEKDVKVNNETQIFIETPYRNNQLLKDLVENLSDQINLCLAIDLTMEGEEIHSKSIDQWRKFYEINISKRQCIFLLN